MQNYCSAACQPIFLQLFSRSLIDRIGNVSDDPEYKIHPLISAFAYYQLKQNIAEFTSCVQEYIRFFWQSKENYLDSRSDIENQLRKTTESFKLIRDLLDLPGEDARNKELAQLFDILGILYSDEVRDYLNKYHLLSLQEEWNAIALKSAKLLGLKTVMADTLLHEANRCEFSGQPDLSIHAASLSLEIAKELRDADRTIQALTYLASLAAHQGKPQVSMGFANEISSLLSSQMLPEFRVQALLAIGEAYRMNAQPKEAIIYLKQALDASNSLLESKIPNSMLWHTIATSYHEAGYYQEALDAIYKSIQFSIDEDDQLNLARNQMNLGYFYHQAGEYEKGLETLNNAVRIFGSHPFKSVFGAVKGSTSTVL